MATLQKIFLRIVIALAALIGAVFTAAFVAILWGDPVFTTPPDVSPEALKAAGISFEQPYPAAKRTFRMRDGKLLASQYLAAEKNTTIVFVHGVMSSSFLHNRSSGLLREAAPAEVVAIDLRGHGASAGKPGDTDYIGQYEDDLGDVIREVRTARPNGKVILAGYSMGGGIALRYALKPDLPPVDGYLLFAPHLGWSSPTTRTEGTAGSAETIKVHVPRLLGLVLMNAVGVRSFNGLQTLFFNMPPELPLRAYTYRASESMTPKDYRAALAAVRAPLLVIVGSRDEAFKADQYETVIRANSKGTVTIIPDATHNGVLHDARTLAKVAAWAAAL